MKKNKLINKILFALALSVVVFACSDDESGSNAINNPDFSGITSSTEEGAGTITIPVRGGNVSESDVTIMDGGTAEEGVDFTVAGVSDEGVEIAIINDGSVEPNETFRVKLPGSGNVIHTVTIFCDGDDTGGWDVADFGGVWHALEDYGGGSTFGPYNVTFVQDAGDANRFNFTNFYGFATRAAYVIFDVPNGTVHFPAQTPTNPGTNGAIAAGSTGTFDLCEETLTVNLNYDGGDWTYRFSRN